MQLLQKSDYKVMPWKNGHGETSEIAKDPQSLWRLSAATVRQPGPFSEFRGYSRLLSIWQGEGLKLNDFELKGDAVYSFQGEEPIFCQNLSPLVVDLGLIFKTGFIEARMRVHEITQTTTFLCKDTICFLFCADGHFQVNAVFVQSGDTLMLTHHESAEVILTSPRVRLICVEILDLSNLNNNFC